jgi:hypothetical protein
MLCGLAAGPLFAGESTVPTTGEFLHRIALARHMPAVDGPDAERLLRESGIRLPAMTLTLQLTEGQVAAISRSLGLNVTSSNPDALFESSSVAAFLDLMASQVPAPEQSATSTESGPYPRPNDQAADPRNKGRGKKKGLPPVSESNPI